MRQLAPEILAASARLKRRRNERLQTLGFALAALAMAGCMGYVLRDFLISRSLGAASKSILFALGGLCSLTLLLSPVLAYFSEEDKIHEKA